MIGSIEIEILKELPKRGDRYDYRVQISGPQGNVYSKEASITRTLTSIWDLSKDPDRREALEKLVGAIIRVIGTASEPSGDGFWFDSYNTEETLEKTVRSIPNNPNSYLKGRTVRDEMTLYVGDEIMKLLGDVESKFEEVEGERFFRSLDSAFERSQVVEDMNNPPNDKANYLYRICILSVVLDRLNFTEHDEEDRSLMGFSTWLRGQCGKEVAEEITEALFMVKRLRRQYPIHEHYEEVEGELLTRQDLVEAEEFFGVENKDFSSDWNKVSEKFKLSFEKLLEVLSE